MNDIYEYGLWQNKHSVPDLHIPKIISVSGIKNVLKGMTFESHGHIYKTENSCSVKLSVQIS